LLKAGRLQQCAGGPKQMRKHWAESIEDVPELAEFDKQLDFPGLLAAAAVALQRRLFAAAPSVPTASAAAAGGGRGGPKRKRKSGGGTATKADSAAAAAAAAAAAEILIAALSDGSVEPQTVLHGDYKAENMCFRHDDDAEDGRPHCAVFDFQWAGSGAPAVDVVYLLLTSLEEGVLDEHEGQLLDHYHARLGVHGADVGSASGGLSRAMLQRSYELAMLDFARFALADGALIECDLGWVTRCAALLTADPARWRQS
jgi:aminoglycoside phosphotransferase (APT) family kinase protein